METQQKRTTWIATIIMAFFLVVYLWQDYKKNPKNLGYYLLGISILIIIAGIGMSFSKKERESYWKGEAENNPEKYSPEDLERMTNGKAPIGSDGKPMELHHIDGTPTGGLEPMTQTDHRLGDNYKNNHPWLNKDGK